MSGFDHEETTQDWDKLYYNCPESIRFYDMAVARMLDSLCVSPGDRILDAGCGAAVHAIRAAQRGYFVDAIDFSKSAIEDGKLRTKKAGLADFISFRQEDLTHLTQADESYDKIFSWGVVIHIKEIEKALDELTRVLAPKGRLALYVTNSTAAQLLPRKLKKSIFIGQKSIERNRLGNGFEFQWRQEKIWVWFNHVNALINHMENRGLRLLDRHSGEFTDYGLHFSGNWLSQFFWQINTIWFRYHLPPAFALTNLLIFEKTVAGNA